VEAVEAWDVHQEAEAALADEVEAVLVVQRPCLGEEVHPCFLQEVHEVVMPPQEGEMVVAAKVWVLTVVDYKQGVRVAGVPDCRPEDLAEVPVVEELDPDYRPEDLTEVPVVEGLDPDCRQAELKAGLEVVVPDCKQVVWEGLVVAPPGCRQVDLKVDLAVEELSVPKDSRLEQVAFVLAGRRQAGHCEVVALGHHQGEACHPFHQLTTEDC
jgi:hypothetical protein